MKSRNYGIDLLRIVSMFYVLVLHTLKQGGILKTVTAGTAAYYTVWFMEVFAYCAVDIFAVISGYVSYSDKPKKTRISSWIQMWLQVIFCGLLVTAVFCIIQPETTDAKDLIRSFFPLNNASYWYFTAYTGLFVMMPLLNAGIRAIPEETLKKTVIGMFLLFSIYDSAAPRFILNSGYSFIWLMILYCIGAAIRKCSIGNKWKTRNIVIVLFLLAGFTWAWKLYGIRIGFMKAEVNKGTFLSYTSPTVLLCAVLHVILFSRMKLSTKMTSFVKWAAPSAFSIYLFNCQKYIWNDVMLDNFIPLAKTRVLYIVPGVLLFSAAFVICSLLADRIRIRLFRFLHVSEAADTAEQLIRKWINRFVSIL